MNPHDLRQLYLMQEVLKNKSLRLRTLKVTIDQLKALLWELENIDQSWIQQFSDLWWDIEVGYASAVAKGLPELEPYAQTVVSQTLIDLERLVKNLLAGQAYSE